MTATGSSSPLAEAITLLAEAVNAINQLPAEDQPIAFHLAERLVNGWSERSIVTEAERILQGDVKP